MPFTGGDKAVRKIALTLVVFLCMLASPVYAKSIVCTTDISTVCDDGASACEVDGKVYMRCLGPISDGTTCENLPPLPPPPTGLSDNELLPYIEAICTARHECHHQDWEGVGNTRCMNEFGGYLADKNCYAEAKDRLCKYNNTTKSFEPYPHTCWEITERLQYSEGMMAYFSCLQTGGTPEACAQKCRDVSYISECDDMLDSYKQCAQIQEPATAVAW